MTPLEESLQRALAAGVAGGPDWLREVRDRGARGFRAAGLPHGKIEEWRFTSLQALAPSALVRAADAASGDGVALLATAGIPAGEPRLVLVNGRLREELSTRGSLPAGVTATSLARAWVEQPDLVRGRLGRHADVERHTFGALNTALMEDGVLLHVPAGAVIEAPVHLVFLSDAPGAAVMSHPRVLIVAGEGARFAVAEHWLGGRDGLSVANGVSELLLADGAEVEHYTLQDLGPKAFHFGAIFSEQGARSRLRLHSLSLGAQLSRTDIHARLAGEGGAIDLGGLAMLSGEQLSDVHSVVEHAVPRCETVEAYKAILDGHSRGVFAGRIRVLPGAQKTQAYQQSSSLLLSEDALIDTMPQLEIFADDVKCGHGGAVGQLDAGALFYLRTRGLDEETARGLLIYAFAAEMVDRIGPPALRARARALVAARLPGGAKYLEAA
jgi:Fe-S cluster assembly protein SufD